MHSCNFCRKIVVFNCASAYLLELVNASQQILPEKASAIPMRRVAWAAATPLLQSNRRAAWAGYDSSPFLPSECCFVDSFFGDVVENPYRQLADKSKGCFQPTFYRDVVAVATQSSKVSQNRVFDLSRDPQTTEMTTSPKILSIKGKSVTNTIRITKLKGCLIAETAPLIHLTKLQEELDSLLKP